MLLKTEDLQTIKKSIDEVSVYVSFYIKLSEITNSKSKTLYCFLNKALSFVNSIFILAHHNQFGETVIIYRCLIERLLLIKYIIENNSYDDFDNWSFVKNYEQKNTIRSFKKYNKNLSEDELKSSKEVTLKYQKLKKEKTNWKEPNLEKYAKQIGYGHLYHLGYNFGSSYVHSRADEGISDFDHKIKIKQKDDSRVNIILFNSLLILFSVLDECVSNTNLKHISKMNQYSIIIDNYFSNKELLELKNVEFDLCNVLFEETTKSI